MTASSPMTFLPGKMALHVIRTPENQTSLSHWGGVPQVPKGWAWPCAQDGSKLSFLGQMDLGSAQALSRMPHLPEAGLLLFFYDTKKQPWGFAPEDRGGWKLEYLPLGTELVPAVVSADAPDAWPVCPLGFRPIETYYEGYPEIEGNPHPDDDTLDAVFSLVQDRNFGQLPHHQIGGFPHAIQSDDMEHECEIASNGVNAGNPEGYESIRGQELLNGAGVDAWRLVLQVDTDDGVDGPGWMWGDSGMLYFWVKEEEGHAGDFSNAWLVLQCC